MTSAEASRRWIQEAVKRPGFRSVVPSARRLAHSDRFAEAWRRWRRAVEFRCARVSIRAVAVRVDGDKVPVDAEE
jgi:hypothetical protein